MAGLIGKKIGMTRVFRASGESVPCTIIEVPPHYVTQIKTKERDGYEALQLAAFDTKPQRITKPLLGHLQKAGIQEPKRYFKEFRFPEASNYQLGQEIRVEDVFVEGEFIDVQGKSKGKGFQGVVKRHGFAGVGGRTHGQHNRERAPGSLGASSFPSRVFKGKRLPGRMGNQTVTVQNLEVLKIYPGKNLIVLKGAVPGKRGAIVYLKK